METTHPDGHFSPRQFSTVVGMSEGSVRVALREGRITASKDDYGRRWISLANIAARFALELTSPVTQAATLRQLHMNAAVARAELGPDEELVASAEAYLRALNAEPSTGSMVEHEPVRFEREHVPVLAGAD